MTNEQIDKQKTFIPIGSLQYVQALEDVAKAAAYLLDVHSKFQADIHAFHFAKKRLSQALAEVQL